MSSFLKHWLRERPTGFILLLLGLLIFQATPASAHALLVRSIPAANEEIAQPPETLEMWFGEPLERDFTRVRLLTPAGEEIPVGAMNLDPADPTHLSVALDPLEPGIYTVAWQTLSSADGHVWNGAFAFTVLNPDGSRPPAVATPTIGEEYSGLPTPAEALTRWFSLVAALLFWGAPFFQRWVVMAVTPAEIANKTRQWVLTTIWIAGLVIILSAWSQLALQALSLGGLERLGGLLSTRGGGLLLARQGLALVGLLIALARPPYPWTALLMLGAPMLLTYSIGSHASAVPGSGWAVLGDYLHLLAAATWLGGLFLLPLLIWRQHHQTPEFSPLLLLRRFSWLATLSIFILIVTGIFSSLVELPNLASLWTTAYGRILLLKLGLVVLALGAAFLNRHLVQTAEVSETSAVFPQQRFNRQITLEIILALGVMLSVAILVQTTPSRAIASIEAYQPSRFGQGGKADDLTFHLEIYPTQVGRNSFQVHLYHDDGSSIGEVQLVRLFFNNQEMGQATADLETSNPGVYNTEGTYITRGGTWDLAIYVRRRGLDDVLTDVTVEVPSPPGSNTGANSWGNPVPGWPSTVLVAGALLVLVALFLLWKRSQTRLN